jgi:hypothetical protein
MSHDIRLIPVETRRLLSPEVWTHLFIDTCNHVQSPKLTRTQVRKLVREATTRQYKMLKKKGGGLEMLAPFDIAKPGIAELEQAVIAAAIKYRKHRMDIPDARSVFVAGDTFDAQLHDFIIVVDRLIEERGRQ